MAAVGLASPVLLINPRFDESFWSFRWVLHERIASDLAQLNATESPSRSAIPMNRRHSRREPRVRRGFVWINFSSMLGVVGWLYVAAPMRVCNGYLLGEQASAGQSMITVAVLLLCGWFVALFVQSGSARSPGLSNGIRAAGSCDSLTSVGRGWHRHATALRPRR